MSKFLHDMCASCVLVLPCLLYIVLQLCSNVNCFNLNLELAKVFKGPDNSYFGYTTDFLKTKESSSKKWILIGAPTDRDQYQPMLERPGVLYKCDPQSVTSCQQVNIAKNGNITTNDNYGNGTQIKHGKNYGWFGGSLAVGTSVMVCSPRWLNMIETGKVQNPIDYMNGICYEVPTVLDQGDALQYAFLSKATSYSTPKDDQQTVNDTVNGIYYHYQYGQMGMSVHFDDMYGSTDKAFIGAPGLRDAAGGLIEFSGSSINIASEPYDTSRNNDYFGYAVTSGKFLGVTDKKLIAMGGPRGNGTGQVKIIQMVGLQYIVKATVSGEETGSYFGSVLCAVGIDLKNTEDVLVVGAPFFGNLSYINKDVKYINRDEGRVYVYAFDKVEQKLKEVQQLKGSSAKDARFGSAICSPGDINQDDAYDLAVGAPFEDDGKGVVYIFNGYRGKFWPIPTQKIKAGSFVGKNLMGFGLYLSQYRMDINGDSYEDLLIGAPNSNSVVLLKSNPTISMDVSMNTSLDQNIIKKEQQEFTIKVCFMYGGSEKLPVDITVNYTVNIDYQMTKANKKERVLASDGTNKITDTKKVIKSLREPQCSNLFSIKVQPYKTDIFTPVSFVVRYSIVQQAGTGFNCSNDPCAVINVFNAKRQIPDADFFEHTIEFYRPGCQTNNTCLTDLMLNVLPKYNYGATDVLIRGPEAGFQLEVTVSNLKDASYGTMLTIETAPFISYVKVDSFSQISCSPQNVENASKSILECGLSDLEVPFQTGRVEKFTIYFDGSRTPVVSSFNVDIQLKTKSTDINMSNNQKNIPMKVQSKADIQFEGVGNPELFVTKKTKETMVTHRFDFTNNGPSILSSASTFSLAYPGVVIDSKPLLKVSEMNFVVPVDSTLNCGADINLAVVTMGTDSSGTHSTRTYRLTEKAATAVQDNLNYNCERDNCKKVECKTYPLGVKAFVTILLKYEMDPNILAQVQGKSKVSSLSVLSIATASMPTDLLLSSSLSHSATAKTDVVPEEQIKEEVAWWVILLGVLGGLLVLGVLIAIGWKFGFFRRKHLESLQEKINEQNQTTEEDKDKLIEENGKGNENSNDAAVDDVKVDVSDQNFGELDKMLKEVQDYA